MGRARASQRPTVADAGGKRLRRHCTHPADKVLLHRRDLPYAPAPNVRRALCPFGGPVRVADAVVVVLEQNLMRSITPLDSERYSAFLPASTVQAPCAPRAALHSSPCARARTTAAKPRARRARTFPGFSNPAARAREKTPKENPQRQGKGANGKKKQAQEYSPSQRACRTQDSPTPTSRRPCRTRRRTKSPTRCTVRSPHARVSTLRCRRAHARA